MERLISFILIFFFCSCSTNKFIREIERTDKEFKLETNKLNKRILNHLKNELKNSNHIYYVTSTIDSENDFKGLDVIVFDEDNNKIYNIENLTNNSKTISLKKTSRFDEEYNKFIYNIFKTYGCDSLKVLSKKTDIVSGISSEDRIYEINTTTKKNRVCSFQRIYYFMEIYQKNL